MTPTSSIAFPSGIFTISLDFELIWGTLDKPKNKSMRRLCAIERAEVIDSLLELFSRYHVSATWCTVGHLFLDQNVNRNEGRFSADEAPIFYGRDLVEKIHDCRVPQEIGSHTFTHMILGDPGCTRSMANYELAASACAAQELGVRMQSFAYPRNRIGHVDLLAQHGFSCYRGQDQVWYEKTPKRRWFHRAGHLIDIFRAAAPEPVMPVWHDEEGIWEIPGSMLYTPSHGMRRVIPAAARVRRAKLGLDRAAQTHKIFHLWFHPTDLVVRKEMMLDGLRQILEHACELRSAGKMSILPMAGVVDLINRTPPAPRAAVLEEVYAQ